MTERGASTHFPAVDPQNLNDSGEPRDHSDSEPFTLRPLLLTLYPTPPPFTSLHLASLRYAQPVV